MSRQLSLPLLSIALVAGLLFPPTAPYIAVYAEVVALLLSFALFGRRRLYLVGIFPFRAIWLGLFALLATLPFIWHDGGNLLVFAFLFPIILAPTATILMNEQPSFADPTTIGILSLGGSTGALAIASDEVFVQGLSRVEHVNNPIHFGALSLVIGFFTLVGLFGSRSQWRFLFLLGPVFGASATVLAATSGPLVALVLVAAVTVPLLFVWFWREPGFRIAVVLVILVCTAASFAVSPKMIAKGLDGVRDVATLAVGKGQIGESSKERLVLYRAAYQAFLASPLFGYGAAHIADATGKYMPDKYARLRHPQHLHSDIADFAVIGGIFGLLAYLSIIISPLLVWRLTSEPQVRRMLILGGLILTVSYFVLGLTNAVLGILPQTALFGLSLGILAALGVQSRGTEQGINSGH